MASRRKKPTKKQLKSMELLRQVLEYRMPAEQAGKVAQAMWKNWGSLAYIVSSPTPVLTALPGVDPDTARLLHLVLELVRASIDERTEHIRRVVDTDTAVELFTPMYLGRRTEAVGAIMLDSGRRIVYSGIIREGDISAVPLYVRDLVRLCIDCGAESLLVAHNHPSGATEPSRQDIATTRQLEIALDSIQVRLLDHLIFTDHGHFSFLTSGILGRMSDATMESRRMEMAQALDIADELESTGWYEED